MDRLQILPRFCGPPDNANGGYLGGRLASFLPDAGAVEVSFLAPCPLGRDLDVERKDDEIVLCGEAGPIARARASSLSIEAPEMPKAEAIAAVAGTARAFVTHPFPGCFVCGPTCRDGLRIAPGPHGERSISMWTPSLDLAGESGSVAPEFLWAALDCPSSFPLLEDGEVASRLEPMVLGRMTAALRSDLPCDQPVHIAAWAIAQEGRKGFSAAALYTAAGDVAAMAHCTWISLAGR